MIKVGDRNLSNIETYDLDSNSIEATSQDHIFCNEEKGGKFGGMHCPFRLQIELTSWGVGKLQTPSQINIYNKQHPSDTNTNWKM